MNDIYVLAKETILNGQYDLGKKLRELTAIMIVGQIDVDEYQELTQLAHEHASFESSETNILNALKSINSELANIQKRLTALEESDTENPSEEEYPTWERWNGLPTSGYRFGDKVTHQGIKYVSNYVGLNVWEPGLMGTEALWSVIE